MINIIMRIIKFKGGMVWREKMRLAINLINPRPES